MLNFRKHTLWRAFVDALIELNDGKEGSSEKPILFQSRLQLKSRSLFMINMTHLDTLFITKNGLKTIPIYSTYKGVPPGDL